MSENILFIHTMFEGWVADFLKISFFENVIKVKTIKFYIRREYRISNQAYQIFKEPRDFIRKIMSR